MQKKSNYNTYTKFDIESSYLFKTAYLEFQTTSEWCLYPPAHIILSITVPQPTRM